MKCGPGGSYASPLGRSTAVLGLDVLELEEPVRMVKRLVVLSERHR
jgi:hypothetical protein